MTNIKNTPWRSDQDKNLFQVSSSSEIQNVIELRDSIGMGDDYFHFLNKDFITSKQFQVAFVRDTEDDRYIYRFAQITAELGVSHVYGITTCPSSNQDYMGEVPLDTQYYDPPLIAKSAANGEAIACFRSTHLTLATTSYLVLCEYAESIMLVQNSRYLLFAGQPNEISKIVGMPARETWLQLDTLNWLNPVERQRLAMLKIDYGF